MLNYIPVSYLANNGRLKSLQLAKEKAEAERRAKLEDAAREKERLAKEEERLRREAEARERQRLKSLQPAKENAEAERRAMLEEAAREKERLQKEKEERLREKAKAQKNWQRLKSLYLAKGNELRAKLEEAARKEERLRKEEDERAGNPLTVTWPEHLVPITLKNLSDEFQIEYMYPEKGVKKFGLLKEGQIGEEPTMFRLNTPYVFTLRKGRTILSTT